MVKGSVLDSNATKETSKQPKDRVEISGVGHEKLKDVKKRISAGYYNSAEVVEDISDKLTKFFDEATD